MINVCQLQKKKNTLGQSSLKAVVPCLGHDSHFWPFGGPPQAFPTLLQQHMDRGYNPSIGLAPIPCLNSAKQLSCLTSIQTVPGIVEKYLLVLLHK